MDDIFNKINIIKDLHHIIYTFLSSSHKYILNIKNNEFNNDILGKYDSNLMCYCIKKNIIFDFFELIKKYARFGKLKNMIWLFKNNYISNCNYDYELTFAYAAEHGDLNILKWLLKNNFKGYSDTFAYAAENGNLDNMKWLLENNFEHDSLTFAYAAKNGNLDNMKWLLENNFEHDSLTFAYAA